MNTQPFRQTGQMIELCSEYLSVQCIWLNVLVMSLTDFRVNPHSVFAWMSRNSLLEADAKSVVLVTVTGLEPKTTWFVNEHWTIWWNWPNDWAVFWVLSRMVQLNVCSFHVTYAFYAESALYSCYSVKELFARGRGIIWTLCDCNLSRNQSHLLCKQTLNHLTQLTKWLSCILSIYLYV